MPLRLKEAIKERGLNATTLSDLMERKGHRLSRTSIGNILNGKHSPKVETLEQIAHALDVDIRELFEPTKEKDPTDPIEAIREIKEIVGRFE